MISLVLLLIVILQQCNNQKEVQDLHAKIEFQKSEFIIKELNNGTTIAQQRRVIVSDQRILNELTDKVEGLRKIKQQIKTVVEVRIDSFPVPYIDTIEINSHKGYKWLKLPMSYGVETKDFNFYNTIDSSGKQFIDSLSFILEPTFTIGDPDIPFIKRIFKKHEPIVTFETGNKYATVKDMSNLQLDDNRSKNKGLKAAALIGAFLIGTKF